MKPSAALARSYGKVFNQVAAEYDRSRPAYPEELIDRACEVAGLTAGDLVLEIGCGTGQLTRSLLARELRVAALEPGDQLIALARRNLEGTGDVEFISARLEDASLPGERYRAVFSASAIHWIDPDVGWRTAARVLVPGGTLALVQYFGLREQASAEDQEALLTAMSEIAPAIAADWPRYRDLAATLAGAEERRQNVSEVWAWLGSYEIARDYAARLFDDVQIAAVPLLMEHSADELGALLQTLSFWSRLSASQRVALQAVSKDLFARIGRPIRSSTVACLLTAQRAACSDADVALSAR